MDFKSFASSANKKILLKETVQGRSLMYTRNRRGPKMLPYMGYARPDREQVRGVTVDVNKV